MNPIHQRNVPPNAINPREEIGHLVLDPQQASYLDLLTQDLAHSGDSQTPGIRARAATAATQLKLRMTREQDALMYAYARGSLSALVVEGLSNVSADPIPSSLPALPDFEIRQDVRRLGLRHQILLELVAHDAFAYDLDNEGKIVRIVANLKGGGSVSLPWEPSDVEQSSHSGLALGPHTEAPYWCAVEAQNGHSPSPSALILTALWNPQQEPTALIPLAPIIKELGIDHCLALTTPWFQFTRSDSFVKGMGEDGKNVSILSFDEHGGFAVRFNVYRFSVMKEAPQSVKEAYDAFRAAIDRTQPFRYTLSQSTALIINNTRALHCRDVVRDNMRTLIRVFGYAKHVKPIICSHDPLLVRG